MRVLSNAGLHPLRLLGSLELACRASSARGLQRCSLRGAFFVVALDFAGSRKARDWGSPHSEIEFVAGSEAGFGTRWRLDRQLQRRSRRLRSRTERRVGPFPSDLYFRWER